LKKLFRRLADSGESFCIGTHDRDIIVWATTKMQDEPEKVEFGLLKGLSDVTKLDFIKNNWRVSEYIPYGSNRIAYEERRKIYLRKLAELQRLPAP